VARPRIEFSLHKTASSRIEDFCPCRSLSRASSCKNGVSFPREGEERTLATAKGLALRSGLVSVPSSWRAPIRVTMASASTATDTGVPKPSSSPVPVDASPALQVIFPDQHSCVYLYLSGFGFYIYIFFAYQGFASSKNTCLLKLILVVFSKAAEQNSQEQSTWVLGFGQGFRNS